MTGSSVQLFSRLAGKTWLQEFLAQLPLLVLTGLAIVIMLPQWPNIFGGRNGDPYSGDPMHRKLSVPHSVRLLFKLKPTCQLGGLAVCGNRKSLFSADRCLTKCLATLQI